MIDEHNWSTSVVGPDLRIEMAVELVKEMVRFEPGRMCRKKDRMQMAEDAAEIVHRICEHLGDLDYDYESATDDDGVDDGDQPQGDKSE